MDYWVKELPVLGLNELVAMHGTVDLSNYATLVDLNAHKDNKVIHTK